MKRILGGLATILIILSMFSAYTLSVKATPEVTKAHHWAILISGGETRSNNNARYWNDIGEMYDILTTTCRYNPSDIFVLYADGNLPTASNCYDPQNIISSYNTPIDYAATDVNIQAVCHTIANCPTATDSDTLFVFVTDHGWVYGGPPSPWPEYWVFGLWGASMNDTTFADSSHIGAITEYSVRIFEMEQCFGGGFIPSLAAPKTIIATATSSEMVSGGGDKFDPWCEDFNAAIKGSYPNGTVVNADANGDGKISILEAFNYAYTNKHQPDIPQYSENGASPGQTGLISTIDGELGSSTYLARPLQLYVTLIANGIFLVDADNVVHYTQDSIPETGSISGNTFSDFVDNGTTLWIDNPILFSSGGPTPINGQDYTTDQTSFTINANWRPIGNGHYLPPITTFVVNYKVEFYLTVNRSTRAKRLPWFVPNPPSGWIDAGTTITASAPYIVGGDTGWQYYCIGWTGTGTVPTRGETRSVNFTMDAPSSITWNYNIQCYLTVVSPYGTPGGMGWYDEGTTAYATLANGTVDIVPGLVEAVFTGWGGDASGTGLTSDPITMNGPKNAIANWQVQYALSVVTDPSKLVSVPGEDWSANYASVTLTAPQYVPNATGISGVRFSFTYWDVDGASQGNGVNPIDVQMNVPHVATAHYAPQYLVTFNQTGVGSDFTNTVVVIDGLNYNVGALPTSFWYDNGSIHNFAFQSPLLIGSGAKEYGWTSTTGLSTLQSDSITVTSPGSVTGNYTTSVHDVAVTNVTVVVPHCASKVGNNLWVFKGLPVYVNVTVFNKGDFDENVINVTLYCNATANQMVGTQIIALSAGTNQTIAFTWNTKGVPYCQNYTITAVATIPADNNPADNTLACGPIAVRIMGDINGDGKVDIKDISMVAKSFGSCGPNYVCQGSLPSLGWNLDCDINCDNKVEMRDLVLVARNFGK